MEDGKEGRVPTCKVQKCFREKKDTLLLLRLNTLCVGGVLEFFFNLKLNLLFFLSLCHPQFHGVYQNQNKVLKINLKARRGEFFEA